MPKYANLETLKELLVVTKGYVDENVNQKMDAFLIGDGLALEGTTLSVTLDTSVFKVVDTLPDAPADSDVNKIHLVPDDNAVDGNSYVEYLYVNDAWEELGAVKVEADLSPYLKSDDLTATISDGALTIWKNGDTLAQVAFDSGDFQATGAASGYAVALKDVLAEAAASGLYKFSADTKGRVTAVAAIQLSDLTALGVASQAALDTEISDRTSADTTLQANIDAEATAREGADAELRAALASSVEEGAAALTEAIAALDYADSGVAGSFVTSVSEADGVISVTRGAVTSSDGTMVISGNTDGGVDLAANIDGSTIVKDGDGVLSVASSALTQYVGANAIAISSADGSNNKTVSLGIASTDVLSQDASGLAVTLGLSWDSASKRISLTGVGGAEIASMDASDFVIDGMLQDASYDSSTRIMTLTVNTGTTTKTVDVDLSGLVDAYANSDGSLSIDGYVINHANSVTAGTTQSTATGTLAHGGSFMVPVVSYDSSGHVTSTSSVTLTLPQETTLSMGTGVTASSTLAHGGTFDAYTAVTVSGHAITPTVTTFTLPGETTLSMGTEATASQTLGSGGTFAAYTGVSVSDHTITPTRTTFTLPAAASLADLGGVGTVTASGDDYLTLSAEKSGTTVTISGSVAVMTSDDVSTLYNSIYN